MDLGNENIHCEDLQVFLTGDPESFLYARSVRNQRIEVNYCGGYLSLKVWGRVACINLSLILTEKY